MDPCPGNWVAIGRVVVYYDRLTRHLVQELNVGTVGVALVISRSLVQFPAGALRSVLGQDCSFHIAPV